MTTKKLSNALGNIGENYIDEAVTYTSKKKSNVWIKLGALAACLCLIVVGGVGIAFNVLTRMDYFEESYSAKGGHAIEGVFYFEVPRDGIYKYDGDSETIKVLSTYWYDRWAVNEYGIYYNRDTTLYVLPHGEKDSIKLYSSTSGKRIDFDIQPDGDIRVSVVGEVGGRYTKLATFCVDGKAGDIIEDNINMNDTVYRIGDRVITLVTTHNGQILIENELPLLPDGVIVGRSPSMFENGIMFYIFTENSETWELFITYADGNDKRIAINGNPPFALVGSYVLYLKDGEIWCADSNSDDVWKLDIGSDEVHFYEFVAEGNNLYSFSPWADGYAHWNIIFDNNHKPVSITLIDDNIVD